MSIQKFMRKMAVLSTILLLPMLSFGQENRSIHVGISEGVYLGDNNFETFFSKTDLQFGMKFKHDSSSISAFGIYQLVGNINNHDFSNFFFASHLLGLGVEQKITLKESVSLLIGTNLLTEIATNFKNGYILGSEPSIPLIGRITKVYHSTPFANSVYLGIDVEIIKGFHFNLSLENNFRVLRKRKLLLGTADFENKTIEEIINNQKITADITSKVGFRIGLNYNFSF